MSPEDWETARRTVEIIDRHGVLAAVNQQMRWEPGVRATKDLITRGLLGDLFPGCVRGTDVVPDAGHERRDWAS